MHVQGMMTILGLISVLHFVQTNLGLVHSVPRLEHNLTGLFIDVLGHHVQLIFGFIGAFSLPVTELRISCSAFALFVGEALPSPWSRLCESLCWHC